MRVLLGMAGGAAAFLIASHAAAAEPATPPMDDFNNAFYTCDNGAAFMISYDSEKPTKAAMTTNINAKRHDLKKTPVATGAQFSDGQVTFWTDGTKVTVTGSEAPLTNCTRKTS